MVRGNGLLLLLGVCRFRKSPDLDLGSMLGLEDPELLEIMGKGGGISSVLRAGSLGNGGGRDFPVSVLCLRQVWASNKGLELRAGL